MSRDIAYLGLLEVSDRIRQRALTSQAVTRALLERIERLDGGLHSFQMVLADAAMAEAKAADAEIAAGQWRGPLHGVPIAIKDLLHTKGLPTMAGMPLNKDFVADEDATVVARLKQAGAVIVGKLHMTEGATLFHHPDLPRPVNPWSETHWTGVSSSGSGIAAAAGFCYGAIGSDTTGSIRLPSAANSVTGLKPTWGRVSRHGVFHLSESFDHVGPMARSAEDAAALLQAIAGLDPRDVTTLPDPVPDYLAGLGLGGGVSDLTIGIDWRFATEDTAPEIEAGLKNAVEVFQGLGARVREIDFPSMAEIDLVMLMVTAEVAASHAANFPEKADAYSPGLRAAVEISSKIDAVSVALAYQARDRITGALRLMFRDVDMVLTPGLPCIVPTWEELDEILSAGMLGHRIMRYTTPFNAAGAPTLSFPGGFTAGGLPVGLQLAGWRLAEPQLLRAGAAFQRATDFHLRRAPLD